MKKLHHPVTIGFCLMIPGLLLAAAGFFALSSDKPVRTDRNPFALQKSAYGKLLARLSETTIDRAWHLGVEQIVPHIITPEEIEDEAGHDHDHADPSDHAESSDEFVYHVTAEQIDARGNDASQAESTSEEDVFVYEVGEESDPAADHHEHSHSGCDGCSDCAHEAPVARGDESLIERSKLWLAGKRYVKYDRTNPNAISGAHLASVKKEIEGMLLRSYKLDPLHYGAYDSYHLFLTAHEYGGTEQTRKRARLIARLTIQEAMRETEDPLAYLTGAAAAYNLFHMDANRHRAANTRMTPVEVKAHQERIGHLLARFEALQEEAEEKGIWQNLSTDRQMEIVERYLLASRSFEQFDAMLARFAAPQGTIEEDVASMLDVDEL